METASEGEENARRFDRRRVCAVEKIDAKGGGEDDLQERGVAWQKLKSQGSTMMSQWDASAAVFARHGS